MGEGEGEEEGEKREEDLTQNHSALSLFRFHLSPFQAPILRLDILL